MSDLCLDCDAVGLRERVGMFPPSQPNILRSLGQKMQNSSQKRIFVHFIIIVLHYFNALAKYSLKYWRCQLAIWSFVSQINIGWTKCIVARPVKFVMGHRQPMQAPALSSDIMNMQCIGFCWCVELTVFELFAVVWNVLKIILGIICYQYVCSFDAR